MICFAYTMYALISITHMKPARNVCYFLFSYIVAFMFHHFIYASMYRQNINKAGYTAISCGRVGRGGNATVRN